MGSLPASIDTLQWHGDTFDLPDGAVLLASSPAYPHQAYRVGRVAYAVQFHVEVTEAMGEEWADRARVRRVRRPRARARGAAISCSSSSGPAPARMQVHAREMFERWCDLAEAVPLVRVQRGVEAVPARARTG